jgi:hypothetical protein
MRTLLGWLGSFLLFFGAACVVAEAFHLVIGDGGGWLSLARVWHGVHGPSLDGLRAAATAALGNAGRLPVDWVLALPSWLVLIGAGLPLAMLGGRGRERGGFG